MRALLICPADRPGVGSWAESAPLGVAPLLGRSLLEHWLEHLAQQGAREVGVLAADRPEQVRALVGDGARWGMRVTVLPEMRELSPAEARAKYCAPGTGPWLAPPEDVTVLDHFPGLPQYPLFTSYADGFAALQARLCRVKPAERLGLREIQPGVWAGRHTRIAPSARLRPPCWLGDQVRIGPEAVIGPMAILEDRVLVERAATVAHSAVGPDTLVGKLVEIDHSLALGSRLVNWRTGSALKVPDAFLLSSLGERQRLASRTGQWLGRVAAMFLMELTLPAVGYAILRARCRGEPLFRPFTAVWPRTAEAPPGEETLVYFEMNSGNRWLRRWPQLWNVARGEFAWIGNRPLSLAQARELTSEFERLWLAAPLGLISLADAAGCLEPFGDDARAHAACYAACDNWRMDISIISRWVRLLLGRAVAKGKRELAAPVSAPMPDPGPVAPTT